MKLLIAALLILTTAAQARAASCADICCPWGETGRICAACRPHWAPSIECHYNVRARLLTNPARCQRL